jgi:tRNA-splicing ligase RtcB
MKKLKIRGKEIRKLGLHDDTAISLAVNLAARHFRHDDKQEVLEMLQELISKPADFLKNPHFAELAQFLQPTESPAPKGKRKKHPFDKAATGYRIFGEENTDREAIKQMETAMSLPIIVKGALMADAHVGYGLPIGGVVAAYNSVIPYGVGMDIGCRMCLSVYPESPKIIKGQRDKLHKMLIENTRFGLGEFTDIGDHELMERQEFNEIGVLKSLKKIFYNQLGSSGHGNHFVDMGFIVVKEFSTDLGIQPGEYFAILSHSGSRGFGAEVAKHYSKLAADKLGFSGAATQLAWLDLDSEEGEEYWQAMTLAGDYSAANHRIIHRKLSKAIGEKPIKIIENHHNFAWKETLGTNETLVVHRKGATPANIGDLGIIPGNMVSPAFIVSGKGNETALNSASHGAGRQFSRSKAKDTFTQSSLKKILEQEGVQLIGGSSEESPMAYKNIFEVMEAQKDLVNVLALFYPKIVRME